MHHVSRLLLRVVRFAMGTEEVCILSGTRALSKAALASATIAMNVRTQWVQGSSSAELVGETLAVTVSCVGFNMHRTVGNTCIVVKHVLDAFPLRVIPT